MKTLAVKCLKVAVVFGKCGRELLPPPGNTDWAGYYSVNHSPAAERGAFVYFDFDFNLFDSPTTPITLQG
jgi:hypothetical protein